MDQDLATEFCHHLLQSLRDGSFVKLSLGNYRGAESGLQKILGRKILVKQVEMLSLTHRYKTRDVVKNHAFEQVEAVIAAALADGFQNATLFTTAADLQYDAKKATLKTGKPTMQASESLDHNRAKKRLITAENKPYLHALGITDANGRVHPTAQDKYRQINKYIEVLEGLVKPLAAKNLRVVDMGAGKGYLTFALYDYLVNTLGAAPSLVGVEYREDLVALCNNIAKQSGFSGLVFEQGTIEGYDSSGVNVMIALHACDTATDDAIAKGIAAHAEVIVVAPCCHKQIRKEMDTAAPAEGMEFLLKHGTLMERQAEMVTDGLRALLLETHGYRTKLFEFISDAHTPKNIMITAVRGPAPSAARQRELQAAIAAAKAQFGITRHYLETLLTN